jgi:ABC-type branched-subunit amino acid transport system ATPase component
VNVTADDITVGYGSATIVQGVSFEVPDCGALAIVGRNGMGKTTLLKALMGYLRPRHGRFRIGDADTTRWSTHRIVRRGVSYAPQEQTLFGELTVGENLAVGRGRKCPPQLREAVLECFPVLGDRLRQHAGTLSGGEQKMLTLAKALVADPDVLVLDEVSDGMQPSVITVVAEVLRQLREVRGCTMLMVEQNLDLSLAVADRISVLKLGRLVYETDAGEPGAREQLVAQLAP